MKKRNVFAVFILPLITFGIYGLYWVIKTKGEMNNKGSQIPTAWLMIIPIVNIWWFWKYSEGVDMVTNEKLSTPITFILILLLGSVGYAVIQNEFNRIEEVVPTNPAPSNPVPSYSTPTPDSNSNNMTTTAPVPAPDYAQPSAVAAPVEPQIITSVEPAAASVEPQVPAPSGPIVFENPSAPVETAVLSDNAPTNDNSSES